MGSESVPKSFSFLLDTASPDDPNELSLSKGETLDIVDTSGKWWQARRADGTTGSENPFMGYTRILGN